MDWQIRQIGPARRHAVHGTLDRWRWRPRRGAAIVALAPVRTRRRPATPPGLRARRR